MSGTLTAGEQIRSDVFFGTGTLSGLGNFTYADAQTSDGTTNPVAAQADTYLTIDTVSGAPLADLFVGAGFDAIENVNDLSPVILSGADSVAGELVYQGDVGGQEVFGGTGAEFIGLTGFGNTFAAPATGGGTYEIAAGLAGPNGLQTLAAASGTEGNNIAVDSGNASIAAGAGFNHIFLGTGDALVATDGSDSILGGSGNTTVNGAGADTIFAGTGTTEFDGAGGTGVVIASSVAGAGDTNVYGGFGSVTAYGGAGNIAAFGGTAGNNVLVSGSGNSSLVGGGNNDLLVASGAGTTTLVAGDGNTTLFGGGATGTTNYFLGAGNDTVVAGSGNEYIQFGTGQSSVFGSTGNDVYGVQDSAGGSTNAIVGFNTSSDYLELSGFGASLTAASFMANDVTTMDGNTMINLMSDTGNDVITLYGVTDLSASNLILPSVNSAA